MERLQRYSEEELIAMRRLARKLGGAFHDADEGEIPLEEIDNELSLRADNPDRYNPNVKESVKIPDVIEQVEPDVSQAYHVDENDSLANAQVFDPEPPTGDYEEGHFPVHLEDPSSLLYPEPLPDDHKFYATEELKKTLEAAKHEVPEPEEPEPEVDWSEYDEDMVELLHKAYTDGILEALEVMGVEKEKILGGVHEDYLSATRSDFEQWFKENVDV
jgi:hypothetical protein